MITEIVTFDIPEGMDRDRVVALFEESAEIWRAHPKLHRKNYLYDPEQGIAGGRLHVGQRGRRAGGPWRGVPRPCRRDLRQQTALSVFRDPRRRAEPLTRARPEKKESARHRGAGARFGIGPSLGGDGARRTAVVQRPCAGAEDHDHRQPARDGEVLHEMDHLALGREALHPEAGDKVEERTRDNREAGEQEGRDARLKSPPEGQGRPAIRPRSPAARARRGSPSSPCSPACPRSR